MYLFRSCVFERSIDLIAVGERDARGKMQRHALRGPAPNRGR